MARTAFLLACLPLLASAAPPPPPSAPAGRWNVEVGPGTCRLQRTVTGTTPARLLIDTMVGTGNYTLSFAAPGLERAPLGIPDAAVLSIDGKVRVRSFVTVFPPKPGEPREAIMAGVTSDLVTALGSGQELAIRGDRTRLGPLALPQAGKAVAALRRCEAEQLVEWGADPLQFQPGGRPPRVADANSLVSQTVLSKLAWPKALGPYPHALLLDTDGKVERCTAVYRAPDRNFEQRLCAALIGRKLGEPALDPAGRPVRGVIAYMPGLIRTVTISTPF